MHNYNYEYKLWIILILSITFLWVCLAGARKQIETEETIASEIIRFHVLANSDSEEDQALKLAVRDEVVKSMQEKLKDVQELAQARSILLDCQPELADTARSVIRERGYDYNVTVSMENTYFPEKTYGDMTFPAGKYEALRICIGEAAGHNWWCVLFPSLCFVDEATAVVPEESKEKLENALPEETYQSLFTDDTNTGIVFDTHIGEWWRSHFGTEE